ncbi:YIP1 family protein [Natrarchaeobaculum sulfurireducens]|uniref:Yip1 domain-containing protein n=1 Tax=Natrarchaeobaculum sulfurireducens TaxID=2044521 RepID=A0A346PMR7_9EURY|nr:YIP1 family protein [Natrarchaeobaculum sulfurireducens]AXR79016.1 hypothetical protein AArc1_2704 [Natrarchaeobaculum sulfurireducens]AXR80812.1 hypothetical protein AArcMg_0791 [Natrarchaeobaculum sulfurireducens]
MVTAVRLLRQLIFSPASFFDERPPAETLPVAIGLVVAFAIALAVAMALIGSILAGTVDATVTMDNPDRPPGQICDHHAGDSDSPIAENCNEPETIERDAGALIQDTVNDYLWLAPVVPVVIWLVAGVALYGAARLAGGSPSFAGTLSLAGWATVPEFVRLTIGIGAIWLVLEDVTVSDLDRLEAVIEAAIAPIEPVLLVASLVTVAWQWHLLTGGLRADADLSRAVAAVAVGVPLGLFTLLGLA